MKFGDVLDTITTFFFFFGEGQGMARGKQNFPDLGLNP